MKPEDLFTKGLGIVGGIILIGHMMFRGQDWWFPGFKSAQAYENGYMLASVLLVCAIILRFMWAEWKLKSPQIFSENFRTNYNPLADKPVVAGGFICQPFGGVHHGISIKGRDGTIVYPKDSGIYQGNEQNLQLFNAVKPATLGELPIIAQMKIGAHGLPEPYYFASTPGNVESRRPDLVDRTVEQIHSQKVSSRIIRELQEAVKTSDVNARNLAMQLEDANRVGIVRKSKSLLKRLSDSGEDRPNMED